MSFVSTSTRRVPPHYQYNFGNHGDKNLAKLQRRFDQAEIQGQLNDCQPDPVEADYFTDLEYELEQDFLNGLTPEDEARREAEAARAMDEAYMQARPSCLEDPSTY